VFITTAHSAKGLDFNNVFLPNLNSGAYQVKRNTTVDDYTRRLLVVAITRSRENLYLTYSSNRPVDFIEKVPSDIASKFRITSQGEATSTTNKLSDTLPLRITISLEKVDDGNFF
jgi:DNA helicase-2/ATP-dependent DNA helicase PcrA